MKIIVIILAIIVAANGFINAQFFFDDFESYNVGEQLVVQNPNDWKTWSNTPGSEEDPYIQNLNNNNVVNIIDSNDVVYEIPNYTAGEYVILFDLYVPDSSDAYFSTLQEFAGPNSSWGMQVYFGHTNYGEGNIDGGGALAQVFSFDYNTWMNVKVTVNLDTDWAEFYLDNVFIHGWIWSITTWGGLNQLGGSGFYAWDAGYFGNPNYYIDNYSFVSIGPPNLNPPENVTATVVNQNTIILTWDPPSGGSGAILEGYNIYLNSNVIDYLPVPSPTTVEFPNLSPSSYIFCVSAVYNEGESVMACADTVIIFEPTPPAPMNLIGPTAVYPWYPIELSWDATDTTQWIRWDAGTNTGNGIGLTNGGTFSCASHLFPDDLTLFNGWQLQGISFYANEDPNASYVIKVWTGAGGTSEIHTQEVTSFNVDDWNNVILTTPIYINAMTDLWFGYEVTHGGGTFPAGCDDGPAIAYKGDMISTGGGWVSMSTEYGLDYNWNIAGLVRLADSIGNLEYYNVYRKDPGTNFFAVIGTTTETQYTDVFIEWLPHEYYVTAVWEPGGESDPSNIWIVDVFTGLQDETLINFEIFPNPASDFVIIESDFEIVSLQVYNPKGQIIIEEEVNNNIYKVDVSQLNPGIYFLQIAFEDEQILKKIVIE